MLDLAVYNEAGANVGSEHLDQELLGGKVNYALLKQAIVMYEANRRQGTVAQKTRAEVVGSTRKLFRQKGTGRARMGNSRTPIRRGGGCAFPRKMRDFRQTMPKTMRRLARDQAVLAKIESQEAVIVEGLQFDAPKTKRFAGFLKAVGAERGCVLATDGRDENLYKSGRNVPRAEVVNVSDLNAYDILSRRRLIFTREAFNAFRNSVAHRTPAGES